MNPSHPRFPRSLPKPLAAALGATLLGTALLATPLQAAIFVKIDKLPGDAQVEGFFKDSIVADSFRFGVDREIKDSGKGGTADINLGIGELGECIVSKSLDRASTTLAQYAVNGSSLGTVIIYFTQQTSDGGEPRLQTYLIVKLDRVFVKSWSTSGDADDRPTEEIAFYYNKIAIASWHSVDGKTYTPAAVMSWDRMTNKPWSDHGITLPK